MHQCFSVRALICCLATSDAHCHLKNADVLADQCRIGVGSIDWHTLEWREFCMLLPQLPLRVRTLVSGVC